MGGLFHTHNLVFFLAATSVIASTGEDRLAAGRHLFINETIISTGGIFALGFFSPGNSAARLYVGIWYNNDKLGNTVVWVANRENPLMDPSGALTITRDGNIVVSDGKGRTLWSSDVSGVHRNATAVLQDSGNLVLKEGTGDIFWQSFDHPTDTVLPNMKLRLNMTTGVRTRLVSWRGEEDPSTGNFSSGFDPDTYIQQKIWRGSETWARGILWIGDFLVYAKVTMGSYGVVVPMIEQSQEGISMYLTTTQASPMTRWVLDPSGQVKWLFWDQRYLKWSLALVTPTAPCDFYNRCGPFGICDGNGSSLGCRCLKGFVPLDQKAWNVGNFSGGCVRRIPLRCDQGDKILKLPVMKLPDRFRLVRDVDAALCEAECLRRCNCTAYFHNNKSSMGSSTTCLIWTGELVDVQEGTTPECELNLRLAASELGDSTQASGSSKKTRLLVITFSTLGALMLPVGILGLFLFLKRRSRRKGKRGKKNGMLFGDTKFPTIFPNGENIAELPLLHFSGVVAATENFSPANKLGEGGFGPVYKGRLPHGEVVAVKRLSKCSGQGLEEFKNEVELIARLQHKNIVQLLGWCLHEHEKILIYEYLPNRSLDKFIFDSSRAVELNWVKRFHIIKGIAQGLLYLHQHSRLHVVHRDLKTSNILLDGSLNAKISDFGLARMFRGNQNEGNTDRIVGTYGYMSPEYALDGHFSEKSDVFSFGVILLEIISGRRNTGFFPYKESLNLLGHAWKLWNEDRGLELVDPSLGDSWPKEEVSRCVHVSLMCVQAAVVARPTTSEIVSMLGAENASLPAPKQPAFLLDNDSYPEQHAIGSINFMTISAVDGR